MDNYMMGVQRMQVERVIEDFFEWKGRGVIEARIAPIVENYLAANMGAYVEQYLRDNIQYNLEYNSTLRNTIQKDFTNMAADFAKDGLRKAGFKIK